MKNGLGWDGGQRILERMRGWVVSGLCRGHTDGSGRWARGMKNGLRRNVHAGLKPLAQCVEALRTEERVGLNRLS